VDRVPLTGSEREPLPGARRVADVDAGEQIEVTVVLRRRRDCAQAPSPDELGLLLPAARRHLGADELAAARGPDPDDVRQFAAFAREHGLRVTPGRGRTLTLAGTAAELSDALRVELGRWEHDGGTYRGRVGAVHLPPRLEPIVDGLFGLDDRDQAHRRSQEMAAAAPTRYAVADVARAYEFPDGLDGGGCRAALLQFGGGFRQGDLDAYFGGLGIPTPHVDVLEVAGGRNAPGAPQDAEVLLDLEVLGAVAPGAELLVVFAENSERGWVEAVNAALHAEPAPTAISISWGALESSWTKQGLSTVDSLFQDAALRGITICCSSGDHGAAGAAQVAFPASSPHVLACGGTTLSLDSRAEHAWNDAHGASGGGFSSFFTRPPWQAVDSASGRGIPDVAGNAVPGYALVVDGAPSGGGGTSAVAPLMAGLVLRIAQQIGRVGFVTPLLYADGAVTRACHDVIHGDNGAYRAGRGWDAVTGWGSPRGDALLAALGRTTPT
jgi:kumamolisin